MKTSNLEFNLRSLEQILKENPATTHINMRRDDGNLVDIPVGHARFTIKQYPNWVVESGAVPPIELAGSKEELPVIPPKPSEEIKVLPPKKEESTYEKAEKLAEEAARKGAEGYGGVREESPVTVSKSKKPVAKKKATPKKRSK